MNRKTALYITGVLLMLNIFAWKEAFLLVNSGELKIYFLNVGQGDSAFIQTPQLHQILIDGGPDSTILSKLQILMPVRDKTIDIVVLSHPEKDHLMGLLALLQIYKIDYVLWTGVVRDTAEYKEWVKLLEKAKQEGTKILIAKANLKIKAGQVAINTLYPFEYLEGEIMKNTSNDSGVVSKIVFGKDSLLFTGDITSRVEKELLSKESDLASDVLKVAHHGSKYSTSDEFLEEVNPKIAVISVGENSYGHPTPETLQRLENFGIKVLRTDTEGDIEIVSDGKSIYRQE